MAKNEKSRDSNVRMLQWNADKVRDETVKTEGSWPQESQRIDGFVMKFCKVIWY